MVIVVLKKKLVVKIHILMLGKLLNAAMLNLVLMKVAMLLLLNGKLLNVVQLVKVMRTDV